MALAHLGPNIRVRDCRLCCLITTSLFDFWPMLLSRQPRAVQVSIFAFFPRIFQCIRPILLTY